MLFQINYKNGERDEVVVQLAPQDTWSVDVTLAHVIVPLLKQLKETTHSYGNVEDEDVPESLRLGNDEHNWPVNSKERWFWLLDELIWAFSAHLDWGSEESLGQDKNGVFDINIYRAFNERKGKAFLLFGKYYTSLWD